MEKKYEYFMLVAEQLNMRKAAEKAYVTHQGISSAIRQLEDDYGVQLFYRTPSLMLTPQGRTLKQTIQQMYAIEANLKAEFADDSQNLNGVISLGVPQSRYDLIVPEIVGGFYKRYPKVKLDIESKYSRELQVGVENRELDFSIIVGVVDKSGLKVTPLQEERFVLVISHNMLKMHFGSDFDLRLNRFSKGVDLSDFQEIPFIQYPYTSRLHHAIVNYMMDRGIDMEIKFETNHAGSIPELARNDVGIGIVSSMLLPQIARCNREFDEEKTVYAFPIEGIPYCKDISLIYREDAYMSSSHNALKEVIIDTFKNKQNWSNKP